MDKGLGFLHTIDASEPHGFLSPLCGSKISLTTLKQWKGSRSPNSYFLRIDYGCLNYFFHFCGIEVIREFLAQFINTVAIKG